MLVLIEANDFPFAVSPGVSVAVVGVSRQITDARMICRYLAGRRQRELPGRARVASGGTEPSAQRARPLRSSVMKRSLGAIGS